MRSLKIVAAALLIEAATLTAQGWGPDVRLTNDPAESYTCNVAVNGDTVHVVWYDNRDGNTEIYCKHSTDGGTTWGPDTRLTNNSAESICPRVAVAGNNVHVAWRDNRDGNNEIYYKRSTDGGTTWGADTRLTNGAVIPERGPVIAVSGNNIHIVWNDVRHGNPNWEIYYKRSTDNGSTWDTDTRLTNHPGPSFAPYIAVSGNNIHVTWWDIQGTSAYETFYKRSTDNGSTWSSDTRLTPNDGARSDCPFIASSGNDVYVVWHDARFGYSGEEEVYYTHSGDNGVTWDAETRLTNAPARSEYPRIAVSGANLHVVWRDTRDGNYENYYKESIDNGLTWGPDIRLTDNPSTSFGLYIAVSVDKVHTVWYDDRDGNWEIYYKRYLGVLIIEATVDFDPNKLNFKSKGRWVTCYIELPDAYSVEDIDESTVAITKIDGEELDSVLYCEGPYAIGDFNENGITDLMVKFDRQALIAILQDMGYDDGDVVELTVAGELIDGKSFEGSDCIEVIDKGKGKGGGQSDDPASAFSFEPVSPNPFREQTSLQYSLPHTSRVQLVIYDALGRRVKTLVDASQDAGAHTLVWDGCDDAGKQLSSGLYFLKFEAGEFSHKARVVILR